MMKVIWTQSQKIKRKEKSHHEQKKTKQIMKFSIRLNEQKEKAHAMCKN